MFHSVASAQVWTPAGPVDDNWPTFYTGGWPTATTGAGNDVYIAYRDDYSKIAVRKWNGSSWSFAGPEQVSLGTTGNPSMASDTSGTPYLAYVEGQVVVRKYNGTSWTNVGPANISAGSAVTPRISLDKLGNVYVGYIDYTVNGKLTVRKFDGTQWSTMGTQGFTGSTNYFDLTVDSAGNAYVAFQDGSASGKITVKAFQNGSWNTIGGQGISSGSSQEICLTIDPAGQPVVAYSDFSVGLKTVVRKFNGLTWNTVGSSTGITTGSTEYNRIISNRDTLFLFYKDYASGNKPNVKKFDGTDWVTLGTPYFSSAGIYAGDMTISKSGTISVVYSDNSMLSKLSVRQLSSGSWNYLGVRGISYGHVMYNSAIVDGSGTPYVLYRDVYKGETAGLKKFQNNAWTYVDSNVTNAAPSYLNIGLGKLDTMFIAYWDYNSSLPLVRKSNQSGGWINLPSVSNFGTGGTYMAMDTTGQPNVLFSDNANSGAMTVRRWNNSSWVQVGPTVTQFNVGGQVNYKIGTNNTQYISYIEGAYNYAPVVKKFNGTSWVYVGTPALSNGQSLSVDMKLDSSNNPYVAFFDAAYNGKLTVKRFNGTTWVNVGNPGFSDGWALEISLMLDKYGTAYVAYQDGPSTQKLVVKRFDGTNWVNAGPATLSPGTAKEIELFNDKVSNNTFLVYSNGQNYAKRTNFTLCVTPNLSHTKTDVNCTGQATGSIDLSYSGGTGPFTYAWTGPNGFSSNTQDISALPAGTYQVVVSSNAYGGCSTNLSVVIAQPTPLAAVAGNNAPCPGGSLGLSGSASGGTASYSYAWTGPAGFSSNLANPAIASASLSLNGEYVLQVTDAKGCQHSDTTSVAILPAPATQASALTVSMVTSNSMKLGFTRGSGNKGVVVVARASDPLNAVPVCGTSYMAPGATNIFFNADSLFSPLGGGKVIYKSVLPSPVGKQFTLKNLTPGTRYYFAVYEYDSSAAGTVYLTSPALEADTITLVAAPNGTAKNLQFDSLSATGFRMSWTNGNGIGRIVVLKATTALTAQPDDSTLYNAGSIFGSGDSVFAAVYSGTHYVVYNGSGNSVTVSNLQSGMKYYAGIYEYNGYGSFIDYANAALKGSVTTLADFVAVTNAGVPVREDFDTVSTSVNVLPLGWHASASITADNGSASATGAKNYGASGSADRALGSLGDERFGVKLVNRSKLAWSSVLVKYQGEQWRRGDGGPGDNLQLQYSTDAYTFNGANKYLSSDPVTWNNASPLLTFFAPSSAGTGPLDGNLAANSASRIASITGLNVLPGEVFWLRWVDAAGVGAGLAADEVEIVPFSTTFVGNGVLTGTNYNDLNVAGGSVGFDPLTGKLNVKNTLNIEAGAELDMGSTVAPALTINSYLYGSGQISTPSAGDGKLTIAGQSLLQKLYFKPGNNVLNALTLKKGSSASLANPLRIAALPKAGSVKVGETAGDATLFTMGNLILSSDTLGTAMIDDVYGMITGDVTVERALQSRDAVRLLSHPFSSAISLNQVNGYPWNISGGAAQNAWYFDPTVSLTSFNDLSNDGSWAPYTSPSSLIQPGAVLRMKKSNAGIPVTLNMSGPVNQGAVDIHVTAGVDSFVAVGNPYPAGVVLTGALNNAGPGFIGSAIYTWDPTKAINGAFTVIPSTKFATAKLPICGAFIGLVSPGSSADFHFAESDKTSTGNTKSAFKDEETRTYGFLLNLSAHGKVQDEMYLYLNESARAGNDRLLDAPKLLNPGENLYSVNTDQNRLSVDSRPFSDFVPVTLALTGLGSGEHSFTVSELNLPAANRLWLTDKLTGIETEIVPGFRYDFDAGNDGNMLAERFSIRADRRDLGASAALANIYPNPASEVIHLQWLGKSGEATISIFNPTGQLVLQTKKSFANDQTMLSVNALVPGAYTIDITIGGEKTTVPFLKQ